jgi:hypothetical protein
VIMGLLVWATFVAMDNLIGSAGLLQQAILVIVPVAVGVASYLGMALAFRVEELDYVRNLVLRRGRR